MINIAWSREFKGFQEEAFEEMRKEKLPTVKNRGCGDSQWQRRATTGDLNKSPECHVHSYKYGRG